MWEIRSKIVHEFDLKENVDFGVGEKNRLGARICPIPSKSYVWGVEHPLACIGRDSSLENVLCVANISMVRRPIHAGQLLHLLMTCPKTAIYKRGICWAPRFVRQPAKKKNQKNIDNFRGRTSVGSCRFSLAVVLAKPGLALAHSPPRCGPRCGQQPVDR